MAVTIQIRNVPDDVHRTMKSRAAKSGLSLSDYLREELARLAAQPTWGEMAERLRQQQPIRLKQTAARLIRDLRDSR